MTWFQAFNPFMIFTFTPFVIGFWAWQEKRGMQPSTVTKMALGCFCVALSYLIMAGAEWSAVGDTATWWWLMGLVAVRVSVHTSQVLNACDLSGHIFAFLVPV